MGQSTDFSEGISLIREAHSDATAILEKWRDLIEAPGEISLVVKYADGGTREIVLPTIREAINRYLGGTFEQITLTDGTDKVIIRLNGLGEVELVHEDETTPANLVAANLATSRIVGKNGNLSIAGNVNITGGVVNSANIRDLTAYGGQIYGAEFKGSTLISGGARIEGNATIRNASVKNLNMGVVKYRKQVLKWGVVGTMDASQTGPTSNGLWTGDVSVLEHAGIYSEPTWSDCLYAPNGMITTNNTIQVYWGESGSIPLYSLLGGADLNSTFMAMWPYKMYEAVSGGYRIRWLPLDDQIHRITYMRTAGSYAMLPVSIQETSSGTGVNVKLAMERSFNGYGCKRLIAEVETETGAGYENKYHRLYGT